MSSVRRIVLAIDQGTTNTKVIALDDAGRILAQADRPITTVAQQPGWVEQDPQSMFANAVEAAREVLGRIGACAADVAGLGIANQTETLVIWDRRTGEPALPAMVWQCRRGGEEIKSLEASAGLIKSKTGLDLDPTFTAAKLRWVFCHHPAIADGLRSGDLLFGTVDTWLVWKLTGGATYATESGNASRTMLFDIDRVAWDDALISLFGLSFARLPECRRSNAHFGHTDAALFGGPIAITGVMGDQQASLLGHGCLKEMDTKITYGTGAFLWINAGSSTRPSAGDGIIRTIAWHMDEPCYAFEGFVIHAGRILDWLSQRFSTEGGAPALAAEAERAGDSAGVMLIPAFQGLGSPWWVPDLRAAILGMSDATTTGNIGNAGLEAVCFQVRAIRDAIERGRGVPISHVRVDGGMTRSRYFLQMQADALDLPLHPSASSAATPFGAALMAGLGAGVWASFSDLTDLFHADEPVLPRGDEATRLGGAYQEWLDTISLLTGGRATQAPPAAGSK